LSLLSAINKSIINQRFNQTKRRITNLIRRSFVRLKDTRRSSYSQRIFGYDIQRIISSGLSLNFVEEDLLAVSHNLSHRFNLLGSGWQKIEYNMVCEGFYGAKYTCQTLETNSNKFESLIARVSNPNKQISSRVRSLISKEYEPIDWHLDFKSGYRWSEQTWYRDIKYGTLPGVDVKLPWELSRMQHLIDMAAVFSNSKNNKLRTEFCDQILDWIAANPPRFGVNWSCTMDVAIRVANWVIAYDLFRSSGAEFEKPFKEVFLASLHDHGMHIVQNLEWAENHRSNHYLSNIAGLLILSIYLPSDNSTDTWLAFCIQELEKETGRQFLEDGSNFEASTNYHRLCSEMIAVCAVFLEALSKDRISALCFANSKHMPYKPGLKNDTVERLIGQYDRNGRLLSDDFYKQVYLAAQFTKDLTKQDGTVPQIGDNDSGRFIRVGGWKQKNILNSTRQQQVGVDPIIALEQDHLNHHQSIVWTNILFNIKQHEDIAVIEPVVEKLARAILPSGSKLQVFPFQSQFAKRDSIAPELDFQEIVAGLKSKHCVSCSYVSELDLFKEARYISYPKFGVYIVRSAYIHLTIRCGSAMNDSCGIHAHEDQLSFEFMENGKNIVVDPGSFVYSPSIEKRNQYRSAEAHCVPAIQGRHDNSKKSIFSSPLINRGECHYFGKEGFVGKINIAGGQIIRTFFFHDSAIEIQDYYDCNGVEKLNATDLFKPELTLPFSPGYGLQNL
jgi:hypothetical protein